MYAAFFGLREPPFNNTPDPRFFYTTPEYEEALASLIYGVQERKGFVLLTGEVGAGKTLISRMMLRHFGNRIVFANIHHAVTSADDLMESVCQEFELDAPPRATRTQRVRILHDFLLRQFSQNVPAVLVLDEAQNLPIEAFEQLRMIGNLEADDAKLLQVVIVGQPELRATLASKELRQLTQRIFRGYHLPEMNREAAAAYVRHRLAVAGAPDGAIFEGTAQDIIYYRSRGLPRVINGICDNVLLSAYAADRRTVDGPFVESVIRQMLVDPVLDPPPANQGAQATTNASGVAAGGMAGSEIAPPRLRGFDLAARQYDALSRRAAEIHTRLSVKQSRSFEETTASKIERTVSVHKAQVLPGYAESPLFEARVEEACRRLGKLRDRFLSGGASPIEGLSDFAAAMQSLNRS